MVRFLLNNKIVESFGSDGTTLLDTLRNEFGLTGTKEGCREGDCGACTVLIGTYENGEMDYEAVNSCLFPLADADGKHIITIEGLSSKENSIIQDAFIEEGATQCGFCTPGFIVSLTGYFLEAEDYKPVQAIAALDGNICRCTGYASIHRAVYSIVEKLLDHIDEKDKSDIKTLIEAGLLPVSFLETTRLMKDLKDLNENDEEAQQEESAEGDQPKLGRIIGGGTDLFVREHASLRKEEEITFLFDNEELHSIEVEEERVYIGGAVTVNELLDSAILHEFIPDFADYFKLFGSLPIRNRATAAGNILNASPIGDMTIFFMALDSQLHFSDGEKERIVPLSEFYTGYKEYYKEENEILVYVSFPVPTGDCVINFEKVSKRRYLDIATVNSAAFIEVDEGIIKAIRLSAGGVAPVPLRLNKTEEFLNGRAITGEAVKEAAAVAMNEIAPISDARGSAEYKKLLLRQLIYAHFLEFYPEYVKPEEVL